MNYITELKRYEKKYGDRIFVDFYSDFLKMKYEPIKYFWGLY